MNIEIITTGNELLAGITLDTNFQWAARLMSDNGFDVRYHTTVGDYPSDIKTAFQHAQGRADVVIVTGGLGPTDDDITAQVAAEFFASALKQNTQALEFIEAVFASRNRKLLDINKKPAMLPEDCGVIKNEIGTAPGFYYEHAGVIYYFLPGVPKEFQPMLSKFVLDDLNKRFQDRPITKSLLVKTFGLKESELALKVQSIETTGAYLGYRAHYPEVHLRISARGETEKEAEETISVQLGKIESAIGEYIFAYSDVTMEEIVGQLLKENKFSVSMAESCTGGLVSHRLTNLPGSSQYFNRAVVCYSNESKINDLGVSRLLLEQYGAVSSHVAEAMAKGILDLSGSDIGVSITGIAGPGGGSEEKPVGTVYMALASKNGDIISNKFGFHGDREQIKLISSTECLDLIRKFLINYV